MARLPWYAFLYRLFGAQGTFWLWIICLVALWWTAKPTLHRISNRKPARGLEASEVAATHSATDLTRWVELTGVEVTYDAELLGKKDVSVQAPVRMLLDPRDAAARWWTTTRALADAMVAPAGGEVAGVGSVTPASARELFVNRYALLEGDKVDPRPEPERVLVIQNGAPAPRTVALPPPPADPLRWLDWMQARADARAALVRAHVRPDVTIDGLLVPMPGTLRDRIKARLDVDVGRWVLQEGRKPRDLESWIFAAAAITLIFLAAGFYGAVRAQPRVEEM